MREIVSCVFAVSVSYHENFYNNQCDKGSFKNSGPCNILVEVQGSHSFLCKGYLHITGLTFKQSCHSLRLRKRKSQIPDSICVFVLVSEII